MEKKKRRSFQQIIEEDSFGIVKSKLPKEWVLHDYRPDYGIDMVIELFEFIDSEKKIAETLGEHIYLQIKSVNDIVEGKIKAYPRQNVEKSPLSYDKSEYVEIDIIKFVIETSELLTVQSMGSAIPVLLLLADLKHSELYYVCLNDYIDKIILPVDPGFGTKKTKTLLIPKKNIIDCNHKETLIPIKFYAKRMKLFSAFAKFYYQRNELRYNSSRDLILHFINIIKKYDFWTKTAMWSPILEMYNELKSIENYFISLNETNNKSVFETDLENEKSDLFNLPEKEFLQMKVFPEWDRLCNLSNMFEELCREWFLPTFLSQHLSYEDSPITKKQE